MIELVTYFNTRFRKIKDLYTSDPDNKPHYTYHMLGLSYVKDLILDTIKSELSNSDDFDKYVYSNLISMNWKYHEIAISLYKNMDELQKILIEGIFNHIFDTQTPETKYFDLYFELKFIDFYFDVENYDINLKRLSEISPCIKKYDQYPFSLDMKTKVKILDLIDRKDERTLEDLFSNLIPSTPKISGSPELPDKHDVIDELENKNILELKNRCLSLEIDTRGAKTRKDYIIRLYLYHGFSDRKYDKDSTLKFDKMIEGDTKLMVIKDLEDDNVKDLRERCCRYGIITTNLKTRKDFIIKLYTYYGII